MLAPRGKDDAQKIRDYFVDMHCFYREQRWWWFVILMLRKVTVVAIFLRGINSDDNFDWRMALVRTAVSALQRGISHYMPCCFALQVLAFAFFACMEIAAQPYKNPMDNLMVRARCMPRLFVEESRTLSKSSTNSGCDGINYPDGHLSYWHLSCVLLRRPTQV